MPRSSTTWKPGQSGNPGGRERRDRTIEELCRIHTPACVTALVHALANPRERVPAAIALLDRGWGKPVTMVCGNANRPVTVDFKWADGETIVSTAIQPLIDAAIEAEAEISWQGD